MDPESVTSYLETEPADLEAEIEREISSVESASITRENEGFLLRVDYSSGSSSVFQEEEEDIELILEYWTMYPGAGIEYSGKKGSMRKYEVTGVVT